MLSRPEYGWANVQIGEFKCCASYLTDLPMDILNHAHLSLSKNVPFNLFIDEEGSEVLITSFIEGTQIVRDAEERHLYTSDISYCELIFSMVSDIKKDIDAWSVWDNDDLEVAVSKKRKEELEEKIEKVLQLLDSKK